MTWYTPGAQTKRMAEAEAATAVYEQGMASARRLAFETRGRLTRALLAMMCFTSLSMTELVCSKPVLARLR